MISISLHYSSTIVEFDSSAHAIRSFIEWTWLSFIPNFWTLGAMSGSHPPLVQFIDVWLALSCLGCRCCFAIVGTTHQQGQWSRRKIQSGTPTNSAHIEPIGQGSASIDNLSTSTINILHPFLSLQWHLGPNAVRMRTHVCVCASGIDSSLYYQANLASLSPPISVPLQTEVAISNLFRSVHALRQMESEICDQRLFPMLCFGVVRERPNTLRATLFC